MSFWIIDPLFYTGIVTWRPLVLQLHKIDEGREYAEFMHLPRKKFLDFGILLHKTFSQTYGLMYVVLNINVVGISK